MNQAEFYDIAKRSNVAIFEGNENEIDNLISKLEKSEYDKIEGIDSEEFLYNLANLYIGKSSINREEWSNWRHDEFPVYSVIGINHFRKAQSLATINTHILLPQIVTNLAVEISAQNRIIENLPLWLCDFSVNGDTPFVSAYHRARDLFKASFFINDAGHAEIYRVEAFKLFYQIDELIDEGDHELIYRDVKTNSRILEILDYGNKRDHINFIWDSHKCNEDYDDTEKKYRKWCLENTLFLNHLNDLTHNWIADQDIIQFPDCYMEDFTAPFYHSSFSALKREFCFARIHLMKIEISF